MLRSRNSVSLVRQRNGVRHDRLQNGRSFAVAALVCVGSVLVASCSTVMSEMPAQIGGLPANTPPRPEVAPAYPAVHDMPPPRDAAVLTEEERKKVEAELAAMRAEQAKRAAAPAPE
jgi:hypothetical protein